MKDRKMTKRDQIVVDYEKETGASFTDNLTGLFNHGS